MAELAQTLDQILSDPDAMAEIMSLARRLGGGSSEQPPSEEEASAEAEPAFSPSPAAGEGDSGTAVLFQLLRTAGERDPNRAALLQALRPYLRAERREKLDRAIRLVGLYQAARHAFRLWKEENPDV